MAQRKAKPDTNPKDDPIVFEDLDGNLDDEGPTDLTGVYADQVDDGGWSPPEEDGVDPRNPLMTEQGGEEDDDLPYEDPDADPDNDGDDAEPDDGDEELETAGEAEEQDRGDAEVDDDLKNLPKEAQDAIMAARREAREKDAEVQRYKKLEYDYNLGRAKEQEQGLDGKLQQQRKDLRTAIEEGDTEKQATLTEEIADTKALLRDWTRYRESLEKQGGPSEAAQPQGQQAQKPTGKTSEANKWLQQNQWFDQPGHEEVSDHVRKVDVNLAEEGYDPNSAEYFAELNRRVKARFPKAPIRAGKESRTRTNTGKRSPVAAPDRGTAQPNRGAKRGKVTLDASDRENMRRFGLDPKNPEHAKIYAQEKRSSDSREQRQRGR